MTTFLIALAVCLVLQVPLAAVIGGAIKWGQG